MKKCDVNSHIYICIFTPSNNPDIYFTKMANCGEQTEDKGGSGEETKEAERITGTG